MQRAVSGCTGWRGLAHRWLSAPTSQVATRPAVCNHAVCPALTWACGRGQCGREPGASALEGTVSADVGQRQHCVERRPGAVALLGHRRHSRAAGGLAARQARAAGSVDSLHVAAAGGLVSNRLAIAKPCARASGMRAAASGARRPAGGPGGGRRTVARPAAPALGLMGSSRAENPRQRRPLVPSRTDTALRRATPVSPQWPEPRRHCILSSSRRTRAQRAAEQQQREEEGEPCGLVRLCAWWPLGAPRESHGASEQCGCGAQRTMKADAALRAACEPVPMALVELWIFTGSEVRWAAGSAIKLGMCYGRAFMASVPGSIRQLLLAPHLLWHQCWRIICAQFVYL